MQTFLTHAGYLALILFGVVEACCVPISSEITFGFAGVLAAQHDHLSLPLVIIIGSLAELAGSFISYAVGRKGGRPAVQRYGRYVLITSRDLDRAERFFAGKGAWAVLIVRLIPVLRAFGGLVSGIVEVPVAQFAIFNTIGTVIFATVLSSIGYAVGNAWAGVVQGPVDRRLRRRRGRRGRPGRGGLAAPAGVPAGAGGRDPAG